jgi:hypothetical protein
MPVCVSQQQPGGYSELDDELELLDEELDELLELEDEDELLELEEEEDELDDMASPPCLRYFTAADQYAVRHRVLTSFSGQVKDNSL